MTEPKWTPGPWIAEKASDTDNTWAVKAEAAQAFFVAETFDVGAGPAQIEANAHLIAAAPDLYRAAQGLYEALDRAMDYIGNGWQPQDIVEQAREARDQADRFLAKATAA